MNLWSILGGGGENWSYFFHNQDPTADQTVNCIQSKTLGWLTGLKERKRQKRELSGEARLEAQTASSHHISKKTADRDYKVQSIDVAEMRGAEWETASRRIRAAAISLGEEWGEKRSSEL